MFEPKSSRLDYGELLSPPPRYKLEFALGTTYSLDLETFTAISVIAAFDAHPDSELTKSPLPVLEAMRQASKKILLFCQGGQIKKPAKPNKVMPLLDNCICEINLDNGKSFHPKIWLLKFNSLDELPDKYRLIVLSRNLTFDRNWDIAVRLDSLSPLDEELPKRSKSKKRPLSQFLSWLADTENFYNKPLEAKRDKLKSLSRDIASVKWKQPSKEFNQYDFLSLGTGNESPAFLDDRFKKMFIISPFLSKSIIKNFANHKLADPDCTLITRKTELPKLDADLLGTFDVFIVKDEAIYGEDALDEIDDVKSQDIHAKLYLMTKGYDSTLYIGSANASHNAFYAGNVEFMIALYGKKQSLNVEMLKKDLGLDEPNGKNCIFERVESYNFSETKDDSVQQRLQNIIKTFCASNKSANVAGDGPYDITVKLDFKCDDVYLTLSPLMQNLAKPVDDEIIFSGLALGDLSEFYCITAVKDEIELSRIVKIQTTGIPKQRDAAVFSAIITNKGDFLSYIAFLLSDDYVAAFLENINTSETDRSNFIFKSKGGVPALYERMLKASARSPEKLREVREIIEQVSDGSIPEDFVKLYEQFEKALRRSVAP
jgi:hypothetical protein